VVRGRVFLYLVISLMSGAASAPLGALADVVLL
jgi:hypothetical protein